MKIRFPIALSLRAIAAELNAEGLKGIVMNWIKRQPVQEARSENGRTAHRMLCVGLRNRCVAPTARRVPDVLDSGADVMEWALIRQTGVRWEWAFGWA